MEGNTEFQKPSQEQLKPESQSLNTGEARWIKGLKDRVNSAFGKREEGKEAIELPKIQFDVFYARHGDQGG